MEPTIIYEDQELLVINKPPGMVVNRSETTLGGTTVQDWIESYLKSKIENLKSAEMEEFHSRSGIVHRLDKDTSGVLIIAKDAVTFQKLKTQFKERTIKKTYLALVHGRLREKAGEINAPIGRNPKNRFRFTVLDGGREAVTEYRVISSYTLHPPAGPLRREASEAGAIPYTLLQLHPKTGRTHQLRVHLVHLGHPIISDPLYSGRKQLKSDLQLSPRIFLHAQSIGFRQPSTGAWLQVEAELPDDLNRVLEKLRSSVD